MYLLFIFFFRYFNYRKTEKIKLKISVMEDLNWKYVGYSAGIALLAILAYHYVLIDYLPEKD